MAVAWHDRDAKTTRVRVVKVAGNREVVGPLQPNKMEGFWAGAVMAFSPDGRWLATGGYGLTQVWDLASGWELSRLDHTFPVKFADGQERRLPRGIQDMVFSPMDVTCPPAPGV